MAALGPGSPYLGCIQKLPYLAAIPLVPQHRLQLERWWPSKPSPAAEASQLLSGGGRWSFSSLAAIGALVGCRCSRLSSRCVRRAIIENRGEGGYKTSAGDKLRVTVTSMHDTGMLCKTAENMAVFLPVASSKMPKDQYRVGMKLEVTVTTPETRERNPFVTDKLVRALDSIRVGEIVEGKVLSINDTGLMLDIGTALRARSFWRQLAPLNQAPSSFKVGDTVPDLKVMGVYKTRVEVVPKSYEVRPLKSLQVGERLEGYVIRISAKANGVFFDVGASGTVAGFAKQLAKRPENYVLGAARAITLLV